MILAGKKKSEIKSTVPSGLICPNCRSKNTTKVKVIGVYKHLLLIPFGSGKKQGASHCTNCSQGYEKNEMPDGVKLAFYELMEQVKTPLWFYSGLVGIKVLVLIKIFSKYF